MVLSSDHLTAATGLSPSVTLSKDGGSFASASGSVSEIGNGWYALAGNATDRNTLGSLVLHATAGTADNVDVEYTITAFDPFDAVRLGLSALPNAAAAASGGLPTFGTGAGQINPDGTGAVPVAFGTALPTTPTANSVGEALMMLDYLGGRFGTAQAGAASTITLDAGASSATNAYVGDGIVLYGGTGGGVRGTGQRRTIVAYNTSTKVATVDRAWDTNPDNTSKFFTAPVPKSDLYLWNSSAPNALQSGRVDAYAGASAASLTFNLTGNITGNLSGSVGSVTGAVTVGTNNDKTGYSITSNVKKNTALNAFGFVMTSSSTHNPLTGATVTATRSLDGGAFGACANSVSEIGAGAYKINLASGDLNANVVILSFAATGADTNLITLITQP
jgi:hypothetical protein